MFRIAVLGSGLFKQEILLGLRFSQSLSLVLLSFVLIIGCRQNEEVKSLEVSCVPRQPAEGKIVHPEKPTTLKSRQFSTSDDIPHRGEKTKVNSQNYSFWVGPNDVHYTMALTAIAAVRAQALSAGCSTRLDPKLGG